MPSDHASATTAAFGAHAAEYDTLRRQLIPPFDAFYGNAIDALALIGGEPKRVLDLGAGTGMLARRVSERYPDAALVLTDGAPEMLAQAQQALPGATTYVADLNDPLPEGDFCAVVSALAIHHIDAEQKQALFARIFAALKPGGIFVNAEQVRAPSPLHEEAWFAWHERTALALGATPEQWAAAVGRMAFDQLDTLDDQQRWLRDAGFTDVASPFHDHCFAVFAGLKPR
jgi:tRNA (cmo5U34)-methyltransferase